MAQHGDKGSLWDVYVHAVDGAVRPDHIAFLVPLVIFIDQFLCMDHFHRLPALQ